MNITELKKEKFKDLIKFIEDFIIFIKEFYQIVWNVEEI